ncbi:MAG: lysophospholipid acyltransferase family protein [Desulfovibrionaceae bacterium]|nr:lysophospholipid acyltransferase family protein [Desulfovibrionaceae bacterium]
MSILGRMQLAVYLFFCRLIRVLGFGGVYKLGGFLGRALWLLAVSRRRYAVESVGRHLNVGPLEARRIAKASFEHTLRSFLELPLARDFTLGEDNRRLAPLPRHFLEMLAEKRPVVAIGCHLGAWELNAGISSAVRPEWRRGIVVREQKNNAATVLFRRLRANGGVEILGHRNTAPAVLQILRENGTVAFLVDHNTSNHSEAVFLPFLGESAAVNLGPALLALRAKAMVYPSFLCRKTDGSYEYMALEPLDAGALEGSIAERTRRIAEFYTRAVEEFVRQCPEQWFWMHHRWKTRE